jgi:streptogramin lyase
MDVLRVDLRTQKVTAAVDAGSPIGLQIAAATDAMWLTVPTGAVEVERVDPGTAKVVAAIDTGPQPESLAVGAGAAWVLNQQGTSLARIDPRTNTVAATIDLRHYPGPREGGTGHNVVVSGGAVWAIARDRTLVRIDPRTNRVGAILPFTQAVDSVAVGDGAVWLGSGYGDAGLSEILRIDLRTMQVS